MAYIRTSDIKLHKDFQSLFPINPTVRDAIAASIRKNGFDENHPIVVWEEQGYLIDGHTRLAASKLVGQKNLPAIYKSFTNIEAAIEYARRLQFDRRNLTDPDLFAYVLRIDTDNLPGTGRKQERLARLCNISVTKAMRFLKVARDGTRLQKSKVLDGSLSINKVYGVLPKRVHVNPKRSETTNPRADVSGDNQDTFSNTIEALHVLLAEEIPEGQGRLRAFELVSTLKDAHEDLERQQKHKDACS